MVLSFRDMNSAALYFDKQLLAASPVHSTNSANMSELLNLDPPIMYKYKPVMSMHLNGYKIN